MISEKRLLRKEMKQLREDFTCKENADRLISENFLSSPLYKNAKQLLLYASFGSEADTYSVFLHAKNDGKTVFFPRCVPNTNLIQFYRIDSFDEMSADAFGILAPKAQEDRLLDTFDLKHTVCVVPGLAFTKSGKRLGYGRGYYDTFLSQASICTVAFCYEFQILLDIPTETHDHLMDYLCNEKGLIPCKN